MPTSSIPLTLLTGFLGSGKTTLLNRLLRDPALAGTAVLINEVGEVGLDQLIVDRDDDEVLLLESGCVCCSMRGDLPRALNELRERFESGRLAHLDRVIIETTGLADPAPVIRTLIRDFALARHFRLDGVVATLDPQHSGWQLAQYPEARRQIALADQVVLSKCDLAEEAEIAEALAQIEALNPGAGLHRGDALPVACELLTGHAGTGWLSVDTPRAALGGRAAPPHTGGIATHLLRLDKPVVWADFAASIDLLLEAAGAHILRLKGLLSVEGDDLPHVLHAVQNQRYPDSLLPAWPDGRRGSQLVFITQDLPRAALVQAFETLCGIAPLPPA
jgi:G3E family GTPase